MEQHLSPDSLRLIAELINDKNEDLKTHIQDRIRMVKMTSQDNNNKMSELKIIITETRDLQRITNGRVNKIEDDLYGAIDKNGNKVTGRDGLINDIGQIKKWKWIYKDWRIPAAIAIGFIALFIQGSREYMIKIIDKIF